MALDARQVEDLFAAALECPSAAERATFLTEACGGDLKLRQRVEALLTAHDLAAGFLQEPFVPSAAEVSTIQFHGEPTHGRLSKPDLPEVRDLGDYQLLRELGHGSMGVVHKARQRTLNRLVALKLILAGQFASPEEVQRFRSEAEAAAILDHPNIVPIYEVGEQEGRHFFSMKLIEGSNLNREAPRLLQQPCEAARLLALVARAVHHAHQRGILHRDLKPSNILLSVSRDAQRSASGQGASGPRAPLRIAANSEWVPHVADFGLAKRVKEDSTLTQSGCIVGTPAYMAPEQAQGHHKLTTAADVYSLGAVLYHILTGRPPFQGATLLETLHQVLEQEPERPRRLNARVPHDLETICLKCLEKDPQQRYGSAEALAEDLERYLGHEPIRARPSTAWERAAKWARRQPSIAALSGLLALVVALGMGLVCWQWQRAELANRVLLTTAAAEKQAREKAEEARQAEMTAKNEARQHLDEAQTHLYFSRVNLAHSEWLHNNNVEAARNLLDRCPGDTIGWEWHYLQHVCRRQLLTLPGKAWRQHNGLAYSPSGRFLACGAQQRTVGIYDAATGELVRTLAGHTGEVLSLAFSPDGRRLASAAEDHTVRLWEVETGKNLLALRGHQGKVRSVAFSPDGAKLASGSSDQTVKVWEVSTGIELLTLPGHRPEVWSLAFSPDGQRLAAASNFEVKVWDLKTQHVVLALRGHTNVVLAVAFSPNGKLLATGAQDHTVRIWDASGRLLHICRGHSNVVQAVAFNRDSTRLATGGDTTVRVWDVNTGLQVNIFRGHRIWVNQLAYSPDGSRLASSDAYGTVHVWGATAPPDAQLVLWDTQPIAALAVSPDSRRIASASGRLVSVWDAGTAAASFRKEHPAAVRSLAFSSSGQFLAWADVLGSLVVWDLAAGVERFRREGHVGAITSLTFDPGGQRLITAGQDHLIKVWDAVGGKPLLTLRGHSYPVHSLALDSGGEVLASVAGEASRGGEIKLWNVSSGREVGSKRDPFCQYAVAFSPDGRRLATGDHGGFLKIWDLVPGQAIHDQTVPCRTIRLDNYPITRVAFSPDGRRLVSGGWEEIIRLWDPGTGVAAFSIPHSASIQQVVFSPDGRYLIMASKETVKVYDGTPWPGPLPRE